MENHEEEKMISNEINNNEINLNNKNTTLEKLIIIQNLIKKESALKELCKNKKYNKKFFYSSKIKR